jgi:hypothetical protein
VHVLGDDHARVERAGRHPLERPRRVGRIAEDPDAAAEHERVDLEDQAVDLVDERRRECAAAGEPDARALLGLELAPVATGSGLYSTSAGSSRRVRDATICLRCGYGLSTPTSGARVYVFQPITTVSNRAPCASRPSACSR